jgi:hypothetical protein
LKSSRLNFLIYSRTYSICFDKCSTSAVKLFSLVYY